MYTRTKWQYHNILKPIRGLLYKRVYMFTTGIWAQNCLSERTVILEILPCWKLQPFAKMKSSPLWKYFLFGKYAPFWEVPSIITVLSQDRMYLLENFYILLYSSTDKNSYCLEPAISLHSYTVPLVQWFTHLLPVMRDPGSIPKGVPGFSC